MLHGMKPRKDYAGKVLDGVWLQPPPPRAQKVV